MELEGISLPYLHPCTCWISRKINWLVARYHLKLTRHELTHTLQIFHPVLCSNLRFIVLRDKMFCSLHCISVLNLKNFHLLIIIIIIYNYNIIIIIYNCLLFIGLIFCFCACGLQAGLPKDKCYKANVKTSPCTVITELCLQCTVMPIIAERMSILNSTKKCF